MAAISINVSTVKPLGDRVFVKPNMIAHKPTRGNWWECLITHGSVLRAVVDYALLALKGSGSVLLALSILMLLVGAAGLRAYLPHRVTDPVTAADLERALEQIERLALGKTVDHIKQHDIGIVAFGEALCGGCAGLARADIDKTLPRVRVDSDLVRAQLIHHCLEAGRQGVRVVYGPRPGGEA